MKLSVLAAAFLYAVSSVTGFAAEPPVLVPPYVCGGIGVEERAAMQALRPLYNLHLQFAEQGSGAYRADIELDISNGHGDKALTMRSAGPLVYARLASGTYRVRATADGVTQDRVVHIGRDGTRDLVFYWPAAAGSAP